jgi:hypothetical protein
VAVGERSYQQALDYAGQRIQGAVQGVEGRAPIIHHPDVKRMLLQMRALNEAGRAMSLTTMAAEDRATHHPLSEIKTQNALRVEVMTPLVKGWCTEMAMEVTSLGVQVHGGMGFIEETGAAQHMRDARILPIYEGTNGIQALDFIGRKCLRDRGEGIRQLLVDMSQTIETNQTEPSKPLIAGLQVTLDQCQSALDHVLAHPQKASFVAYQFMMLFGNSVAYWQLTILGCAAADKIQSGDQDEFLKQKLSTAQFYKTQILPRNQSHLEAILADSEFIDNLKLN